MCVCVHVCINNPVLFTATKSLCAGKAQIYVDIKNLLDTDTAMWGGWAGLQECQEEEQSTICKSYALYHVFPNILNNSGVYSALKIQGTDGAPNFRCA